MQRMAEKAQEKQRGKKTVIQVYKQNIQVLLKKKAFENLASNN